MVSSIEGVNKLVDAVEHIQLDCDSVIGQEIDQKLVDWYNSRFCACIQDGVPDAISCYLKKLVSESTNDITRAVILSNALDVQLEGKR